MAQEVHDVYECLVLLALQLMSAGRLREGKLDRADSTVVKAPDKLTGNLARGTY